MWIPIEKESHFNFLKINKNGVIGSTKVSHDNLKFQGVSENLTWPRILGTFKFFPIIKK